MKVERGDRIFVSGGSGGIGSAVCRKIAENDLIPIVGYHRNKGKAEALAKKLGGAASYVDFSNMGGNEAPIAALEPPEQKIGGIILAASPAPCITPLRHTSAQEMQVQWEVNVLGHWRLCQFLIDRYMKVNRRGVIVGILSKAMSDNHDKASPHMGAYIVAKYGLKGLIHSIDAEYRWLRTETTSPGYTETPMLDVFDSRFLEIIRKKQTDGQFATPETVAKIVLEKLLHP